MRSSRLSLAACVFTLCCASSLMAQGPGAERFEKKVRPLLLSKCTSCHSATKQKGGLRLDTLEAFSKGGDSGPSVVAGKPDESRLIEAVRYSADLKMPPKGKLTDAEIADLVAWVREGANWPAATAAKPTPASTAGSTPYKITDEQRRFWAFQPPIEAKLPDLKNASWAISPIDRFILHDLEKKGLTPAPASDRRNLIRRATYDLTGLPPTPEEVDAFLADTSSDAFARVVDRLLGSARYGERWGRHWLDLARYADSNGMDENVAYANAFQYRDYVVRAFNADKPYNVFIKEQLAGDLMPAADNDPIKRDRLTATGFLVLGPKMLAEDDPRKMEMDIIDEQVDTVGRVFMGLTLGCARCHDHKFDPVPTTDYYALAGIFKSTKSMQNHTVVAMWNEQPLATESERKLLDAHKKALSALNSKKTARIDEAKAAIRKEVRSKTADYVLAGWQSRLVNEFGKKSSMTGKPPAGAIVREAEKFDKGNVLIDTTYYGVGVGVILNKGELPNFTEYTIEIPKDGVYGIELRYAAAEARPGRMIVNGVPRPAEVLTKATGSWTAESQAWQAEGLASLKQGKTVIRIESSGPFPHIDKIALVPLKLPDGLDPANARSSAELARERKLSEPLIDRWAAFWTRQAADPKAPFHNWFSTKAPAVACAKKFAEKLADTKKTDAAKLDKDAQVLAFRKLADDPDGPYSIPRGNAIEKLFDSETAKAIETIKAEITATEGKAPKVTEVMSVEDQKVGNLRVHIRGNHLTLGDEVPRRFLRVVSGDNQASLSAKQSGRLELAEWLTSPDHPLTARVMVNRIWQGHFGDALVRSPDNFGKLGERPTHPELLDWLAKKFVASGWSIKAMHRLIMLSSTYQMSSKYNAAAAQIDPENRLYWRVNRRRLEAESVRDGLLAVSGQIDLAMGGTFLPTKNHAYVNNTGERGSVSYDLKRRSIYLPVIRSGLYEVFQAFDFADPSASNGMRIPTTVAPQALFMLNDQLILSCSESLARQLLALKNLDEAGRVKQLYRRVFGRVPTEAETARASAYLRKFEANLATHKVDPAARPLRAWQTLCQATLASSEFLYLD